MKDNKVIGKSKILLVALIFLMTNGYSQQLSMQVIVPAASVILAGGIDFSQTIGETAVEEISSPDYILTQGFQQPKLKVKLVNNNEGNGVKAYPNPAVDYVNVELWGDISREFRITVINMNGTIVYSKELSFAGKYWHIEEVPISTLSKGLYFVSAVSKDGVIYRSFKIDKM
jgi:hypothetical protein